MGQGQRSPVEILAAIANTERVTAFLAGYAEHDEAIERLVDDITVARLTLVDELRRRFRPHTRAVLRST